MDKLEKVIKGLECHKRAMYGEIDEHGIACNSCPYKDMESSCHSRTEGSLIKDAIALLKAQEPVTPQDHDPVIYGHRFMCGKCHHKIWRNNNVCPNCGRAVKWE